MYLLKRLRDQGLAVNQLNIIFELLIVNRIRYAIPAGVALFLLVLRGVGQSMLFSIEPSDIGFCKNLLTVEQIVEAADYRFFTATQHPDHCINNILPDVKDSSADLRHQYLGLFPQYKYDIYRKSFVPRCLL